MTNAEARFNNSLRPRKPEGSLGRTAQDGHLDSHTAPELCTTTTNTVIQPSRWPDEAKQVYTSKYLQSHNRHKESSSFARHCLQIRNRQRELTILLCVAQIDQNTSVQCCIQFPRLEGERPVLTSGATFFRLRTRGFVLIIVSGISAYWYFTCQFALNS